MENHEEMSQLNQSNLSHPAPFLRKAYEIVDNPETNRVISWGAQGRSFVVWKPADFSRDLLPKFFKHNNFSSFVRQLNTYGFRKVDPDKWEFANDGFIQGRKDLLNNIQRRKAPATAATKAAEPANREALCFNWYPGQVVSTLPPLPSHVDGNSNSAFTSLPKQVDKTLPPEERMKVLVSDYLRPGQAVLSSLGVPSLGLPCEDTSSSTPCSPSTSLKTDQMPDVMEGSSKALKRQRSLDGQAAKPAAEAEKSTCTALVPGSLPPGIIRPVAQDMSVAAHNLFAEMKDQLGRINQLASQVGELKEENRALRQSVQALTHQVSTSNPGSSAAEQDPEAPQQPLGVTVANLSSLLMEQQEKLWQQKCRNDQLDLQVSVHNRLSQAHVAASSALEARMDRHETQAVNAGERARELAAEVDDAVRTATQQAAAMTSALAMRLQQQENVVQEERSRNSVLEARLAELEAKLSGQGDEQEGSGQERITNQADEKLETGCSDLGSMEATDSQLQDTKSLRERGIDNGPSGHSGASSFTSAAASLTSACVSLATADGQQQHHQERQQQWQQQKQQQHHHHQQQEQQQQQHHHHKHHHQQQQHQNQQQLQEQQQPTNLVKAT